MWLLAIAVLLGILALVLALMTIRASALSPEVTQRLKLVQTEFSPAEFEASINLRREDRLSGIPWLNGILARLDFAARVRIVLQQAGVDWSVGMLLTLSLCTWLGTAALLYLRLEAVLPALGLAVLVAALPALYVLRCRTQRMRRFEELLPEALTLLVSALRVGHSFMTALGYLGQESGEPLAGEFRKCFEEQNYGIDMRTAMMNLARRVPLQDIRMFISAILIHKESGGNLAEVLERVGATIRERFRLKKQVRVHTAQGRMTGWILSLLPVVLGLGMYIVNPDAMSILWTRSVGLTLL